MKESIGSGANREALIKADGDGDGYWENLFIGPQRMVTATFFAP